MDSKGKKRDVQPGPVDDHGPAAHKDQNTGEQDEGPNLESRTNNAQRIEESVTWENFVRSAPNSPSEPKKVYCVFHGRTVGIFETWAVTEAQCSGFRGARYKGYTSLEAATAAWEHAQATGAVGPLKSPPGKQNSSSSIGGPWSPPRQPAKESTTAPPQTSDPANLSLVSPGGPFVSYYVVVRGDSPGVYQTNELAIKAMGENPRAHRIQVASMQDGDALFREQYMDGNVVSLKDTPYSGTA